ncbi:UDP-glucuronic acid decarboxylase family protein [Frateuria aurantia]
MELIDSSVLVAGGAGFLGSHLCDKLLALGNKVFCVDDLSTGRIENVQALIAHPNFHFINQDILDSFDVEAVDFVFNLACPASPPAYQQDAIRTLKICFDGTLNLLNIAKRYGARFFQASTSEIYGEPLVHPQTERYRGNVNTLGPRACYDEGKRVAETLCYEYEKIHGLEIRIVRIFNTYGPRMDPKDGRVVSNFIVQALAGEDITLYGDGSQTRSFCYVDDLIGGFILLMNSSSVDASSPVNLGNPDERSVKYLAEKIISLTGSRSEIVCRPLPQDDPTQRCPDISRAIDVLNWEPTIDMDSGIKKTIEYFRNV